MISSRTTAFCFGDGPDFRGALIVHDSWAVQLLKRFLGEDAIVTDRLGLKEASIGLKANLSQSG